MKKILMVLLLVSCKKSAVYQPKCDTSKLKNFGQIVHSQTSYEYYGDYLRDTGYYHFDIFSQTTLTNCEVIDKVK